jgi:hypothetical protein
LTGTARLKRARTVRLARFKLYYESRLLPMAEYHSPGVALATCTAPDKKLLRHMGGCPFRTTLVGCGEEKPNF